MRQSTDQAPKGLFQRTFAEVKGKVRFRSAALLLTPLPFLQAYYYAVHEVSSRDESMLRHNIFPQFCISTTLDVDHGKIGYRHDGTFSQKSPLDVDNQERFKDFVQIVKEKVAKRYPGKPIEIIPVIYSPYSGITSNDIFSFVTLYDGAKLGNIGDYFSYLNKFLFEKPIDQSAMYVFINTAPFFEDVVELSGLLKDEEIMREDVEIDSVFRYIRSCIMSPTQRESVLDLNLMIHDLYTDLYPFSKVVYQTPIFFFLPLLAATAISRRLGHLTKSLSFSLLGTVIFGPLINGVYYAKYEQQKRELIHWYLDTVSADDLRGMLTHLFRTQDNDHQAISCLSEAYLKRDVEWYNFGNIISEWVQIASPIAIPTREEFMKSLISHCQDRCRVERLDITPDPYEVYKDDEGFDYVFIA